MADLSYSAASTSSTPVYVEEKLPRESKLAMLNPARLWRSLTSGEDLPYPGTNDAFGKEAKLALATNFMFDGAKVELQKSISLAPMFQVNHSFALGGQTQGSPGPSPGNYNFAAVVVHDNLMRPTDQAFMQASVEGNGGVFGVLKYDWGGARNGLGVSKIQVQLPPTGSLQGVPAQYTLDHEIRGDHWSGSFSAANPSLLDSSGIFGYSHLQSITESFALGASAQYINLPSRPDIPSLNGSLRAKLHNRTTKLTQTAGDSIFTAELPITGGPISGSYWQYLGDQVEAGAELVLAPDMEKQSGGLKAATTVGLKFDYRQATYRGQISSDGKIAAHLEQRLNPMMVFTLCGEIDQWRNSSKFGLSIQLEGTGPEDMNRMQEAAQAKAQGRLA